MKVPRVSGLASLPSRQTIRDFLRTKVFYSDTDPEDERKFQEYLRQVTVPIVYVVCGLIVILDLIFWPTDFYILSDPSIIRVYVIWRSFVAGTIITMMSAVHFFDVLKTYINLVIVLCLSITFGGIAFAFGMLEGLKGPFFWVIYIAPWTTMFLGLGFLKRFASTFLITFSWGFGYIIADPSHLNYPKIGVPITLTTALIPLTTVGGHVLYHFFRMNYFKEQKLEEQKQKMERLARYDQLTGLYNRRTFEKRFEQEFDRANRYDKNLCLLMMDLDHFKDINDTFGHPAGDEVLRKLGTLIDSETRSPDISGRYGGEEFAVILPETSLKDGQAIASRLQERLSDVEFDGENEETFRVTCSIGIAERTDSMTDYMDLIKNADNALYNAKESGRNCIRLAQNNSSE